MPSQQPILMQTPAQTRQYLEASEECIYNHYMCPTIMCYLPVNGHLDSEYAKLELVLAHQAKYPDRPKDLERDLERTELGGGALVAAAKSNSPRTIKLIKQYYHLKELSGYEECFAKAVEIAKSRGYLGILSELEVEPTDKDRERATTGKPYNGSPEQSLLFVLSLESSIPVFTTLIRYITNYPDQQPRISQSELEWLLCTLAARGREEQLQIMLAESDANPGCQDNLPLYVAALADQDGTFHTLLADARTDIGARDGAIIDTASRVVDEDIGFYTQTFRWDDVEC